MYLLDKFMEMCGFIKAKGAIAVKWRVKRPLPKIPKAPIVINNDKPIQFVMNDPSTPDLIKNVLPPKYNGVSAFAVKNYKGGGFSRTSEEGQAANCFVVVTNTLNYFNSKSSKTIPSWPGTSTLQVVPRSGIDLNAYYDRASLRFFSYTHKQIGGTIYTCDSSEIVAHELGHAIFDSYRPETWNAALFEVDSFHESFADFTAIMHAMLYDEMIVKALTESSNTLRTSNVLSNLAEQFGVAIYNLSGKSNARASDCLRSAINSFSYVNPATLPNDAPDNQLSFDPHSFGKIFLGAFYDIFIMMYEDNISKGFSPLVSVKNARDTLTTYVLKAIQNVPVNAKFFQSMATTILWADVVINNRQYHDRMHALFVRRNLSPAVLRMMSVSPKCPEDSFCLKKISSLSVKLQDKFIRTQSNNPLYEVLVEIPNQEVYLYDQDKNAYDSISISDEESLQGACDMVNYLHDKKKVSDDPTTPFEIFNGKLHRTHIS